MRICNKNRPLNGRIACIKMAVVMKLRVWKRNSIVRSSWYPRSIELINSCREFCRVLCFLAIGTKKDSDRKASWMSFGGANHANIGEGDTAGIKSIIGKHIPLEDQAFRFNIRTKGNGIPKEADVARGGGVASEGDISVIHEEFWRCSGTVFVG